jgi:hypothetical protein
MLMKLALRIPWASLNVHFHCIVIKTENLVTVLEECHGDETYSHPVKFPPLSSLLLMTLPYHQIC